MNFYNFHPLIAEIVDYNTRYNIQLPEGINWNCDENQNIVGIYKDEDKVFDIQQLGIFVKREICKLYQLRIQEEMREDRIYHFGIKIKWPMSFCDNLKQILKDIPLKKGVRRVLDVRENVLGITLDGPSKYSINQYGKYLEHKIYKNIRASQGVGA